jgi:6-phosphofructo-2-kinase/fructose-2,6-biphosphatase 2
MNVDGRIGGDSDLSYRGKLYATALANYIHQQEIPGLRVWTSWLKRTIQTVATIPAPQERWKALNEIDAVSVGSFIKCTAVSMDETYCL